MAGECGAAKERMKVCDDFPASLACEKRPRLDNGIFVGAERSQDSHGRGTRARARFAATRSMERELTPQGLGDPAACSTASPESPATPAPAAASLARSARVSVFALCEPGVGDAPRARGLPAERPRSAIAEAPEAPRDADADAAPSAAPDVTPERSVDVVDAAPPEQSPSLSEFDQAMLFDLCDPFDMASEVMAHCVRKSVDAKGPSKAEKPKKKLSFGNADQACLFDLCNPYDMEDKAPASKKAPAFRASMSTSDDALDGGRVSGKESCISSEAGSEYWQDTTAFKATSRTSRLRLSLCPDRERFRDDEASEASDADVMAQLAKVAELSKRAGSGVSSRHRPKYSKVAGRSQEPTPEKGVRPHRYRGSMMAVP